MSENYSGENRRKFERIPVTFAVFYRVNSPLHIRMQVGDKEVDALAIDISEGGMALLTNYEIPASTIVTVKFIIVNDKAVSAAKRSRSINVQGEVRYSSLTNRKAYRLGVKFIDLSDDDREFIGEFTKRFKSIMA